MPLEDVSSNTYAACASWQILSKSALAILEGFGAFSAILFFVVGIVSYGREPDKIYFEIYAPMAGAFAYLCSFIRGSAFLGGNWWNGWLQDLRMDARDRIAEIQRKIQLARLAGRTKKVFRYYQDIARIAHGAGLQEVEISALLEVARLSRELHPEEPSYCLAGFAPVLKACAGRPELEAMVLEDCVDVASSISMPLAADYCIRAGNLYDFALMRDRAAEMRQLGDLYSKYKSVGEALKSLTATPPK